MTARHLTTGILVLLLCATGLVAQAEKPSGDGNAATKVPRLRTVALLGYEVKWLDDPAEQKEAAEVLSAVVSDRLSATDEVVIVERVEIEKILQEQKLNLSGLVDEANRVRIGKLLGARFLLWGRGFKLGKQLYITTKIVNVETGQYKGIIVQLPTNSGLSDIITAVADEMVKKLPAKIKRLAPAEKREVSPAEMLKLRIGEAKKSWLIASAEEHKGPPIIDPAIRNELEHLLSGAEQAVKSLDKKSAKKVLDGDKKMRSFDPDVKSDYYVLAEGFSEFGKRLSGDLVVCVARVELKIVDAKTGNIVAAGSKDSRATDLSEQLAAKQALRKATRSLLLELSEKAFPPAKAKAADKAKP